MADARRMVVLTTGDPVPAMLQARGTFAQMIHEAARGAYDGPLEAIDARTSLPAAPPEGAFIVITGSSAYVSERAPWVLETEAFLRRAIEIGTPIFGICFGHQLLAQALGGHVDKNPRGREMGTIRVTATGADPILDGLPAAFDANATHLESVVRLPAGASVLARSSLDDHQIVRFAADAVGVQFHPEIDAFIMRGYLEARRAILEGEARDVDAMLAAVREGPMAVRVFENFIRGLR